FAGAGVFWSILTLTVLTCITGGIVTFVTAGWLTSWLPLALLVAGAGMTGFGVRVWRHGVIERQNKFSTAQEAAKMQAIVRTSQMFAHDLRKPFMMLKTAVKALSSESEPK